MVRPLVRRLVGGVVIEPEACAVVAKLLVEGEAAWTRRNGGAPVSPILNEIIAAFELEAARQRNRERAEMSEAVTPLRNDGVGNAGSVPPQRSDLLTTREIGARWGRSDRQVRYRIEHGTLEARRGKGGAWLVAPDDLRQFEDEHPELLVR